MEPPQTPRGSQQNQPQGPMDSFLQPTPGSGGELVGPRSAPPSPASSTGREHSTLDRISEELRSIAASMATKTDLLTLTTTIQDALRAEMAGIRTEVTAQGSRIEVLEHSVEAQSNRISATDMAVSRQGDMLLDVRRHLEDLDNRGRRCNIRVRGVPETGGEENGGGFGRKRRPDILNSNGHTELLTRAHLKTDRGTSSAASTPSPLKTLS
ncbi:Hypothetical predicted protein [Pelobates cultripes]|uniref:Uncharacterized protein n=1 Tax=Pelobates cultripes TaxID=61616 RepID=A0AAD1S6N6_PELCU|nr:Hypothetical predicted protein [Pelobates cultripes]